jgi:hypothetical protein
MAGITARFTEKSARTLSEAGFCREKVITDWKVAMKAMLITVVAATKPSFREALPAHFSSCIFRFSGNRNLSRGVQF